MSPSFWCRVQHAPKWNRFDIQDPFIVETGGAVFVPHGLFDFPLERIRTRSPYQVIEFGLPYHMLREVPMQIDEAVETPLHGFGNLSVEAIMEVTGLPHADAILAKHREYDEPFLPQGPQALVEEVCRQIATRGLRWTKGGRLFHLTGKNDTGAAASVLLRCYHRQHRRRERTERIETVGIGDSINDVTLLAMVDYPILVRQIDGSYDPDIHLSGMIRAPGIGPVGWNEAVLDLLAQVR